MNKFRPLLAALNGVLFFTITDILIWQRIFEANRLLQYADLYHAGWFLSLAGYAALGVIAMADHWKECLYFLTALIIGANSGLEDVLYYVLDRKPMPASLPWLDGNPLILQSSRAGVIGSSLFWLAVLIVLFAVLFLWNRKPSRSRGAPSASNDRPRLKSQGE